MTPEELRQTFADAEPGFFMEPELQKIASLMAGEGQLRPAPCSGLPALLDAPFKEPVTQTLQDFQVALVGMPMDMAVTNRTGARFGGHDPYRRSRRNRRNL